MNSRTKPGGVEQKNVFGSKKSEGDAGKQDQRINCKVEKPSRNARRLFKQAASAEED